MDNKNAQFAGSIPAACDRHPGPIFFQPHAEDLAARLAVDPNSSVLELACGTRILTRKLRDQLPASVKLVATDLNEPMFRNAAGKFQESEAVEWAKDGPDATAFSRSSGPGGNATASYPPNSTCTSCWFAGR